MSSNTFEWCKSMFIQLKIYVICFFCCQFKLNYVLQVLVEIYLHFYVACLFRGLLIFIIYTVCNFRLLTVEKQLGYYFCAILLLLLYLWSSPAKQWITLTINTYLKNTRVYYNYFLIINASTLFRHGTKHVFICLHELKKAVVKIFALQSKSIIIFIVSHVTSQLWIIESSKVRNTWMYWQSVCLKCCWPRFNIRFTSKNNTIKLLNREKMTLL